MKLKPYVAELKCGCINIPTKATWTLWAKDKKSAERQLNRETKLTIIELAPLGKGLRRHWTAG